MSRITINPKEQSSTITVQEGGTLKYLEQHGRFPPVTLHVYPLANPQTEIFVDKFISYSFQSSITIPVDVFSCELYYEKINVLGAEGKIQEGDIFVCRANGIPIATGIVDQLDMETDANGTKLAIQGRDLLSQWEDQDAVSLDSNIKYANKYSLRQVVQSLCDDTRIDPRKLILRNAPTRPYLFATQPGESKLSAMQRHCEALDIYFWMQGDGSLIVGKPAMRGQSKGELFMLRAERRSNVLAIRSSRNSTSIPNIMVAIWNGQETVISRTGKQQRIYNDAPGAKRLRQLGHRVPRAIIISTPEGGTPQDLAAVNALEVAGQNASQQKLTKAGASTILQAYAKVALARANLKDLAVEITVPGHYNDRAEPWQVDQVYRIRYDLDDIDEDMYLHEVQYLMSEQEGQRTRLHFCRQQALVSDVRAL